MDLFVWSTIILVVWAALGPLVGIRYGQELAKRWQKEHWVRDNAKEEFRELLSALVDAANTSISYRGLGRDSTPAEDKEEEKHENTLYQVIHTRLFIRGFIEKESILDKWHEAFIEHGKTQDLTALQKSLRELIDVVVSHATKLNV